VSSISEIIPCIILNIDTYMHIKLFGEILDTFHSQINWLNYILLANVILVYNSKECRVFTASSFNAVDVKSFCSDKEHWFFRNRGSIKSNCTALCARSSLNAKNSFHQVQSYFAFGFKKSPLEVFIDVTIVHTMILDTMFPFWPVI
jgi:hypothetical protein